MGIITCISLFFAERCQLNNFKQLKRAQSSHTITRVFQRMPMSPAQSSNQQFRVWWTERSGEQIKKWWRSDLYVSDCLCKWHKTWLKLMISQGMKLAYIPTETLRYLTPRTKVLEQSNLHWKQGWGICGMRFQFTGICTFFYKICH